MDQSLSPGNMLRLYAQGAFPMADEENNIDWYFPEIRTVIDLNNFNIPRSLKKFMLKSDFEFKFDYETLEIIKNCANREETWISEELIDAYLGLIEFNALHSVGVFQNNKLVGGLYGITFRGAFFGESMFSKISQASKAALSVLIKHLKEKGFSIIDVQYQTDHLKMFGATEIELTEYESLLLEAYETFPEF